MAKNDIPREEYVTEWEEKKAKGRTSRNSNN